MDDAESGSLTIDEIRATLKLDGLHLSRDQFRRWYRVGLLEAPAGRRRGRGTGRGWEATRYPSTVLDRLRIIGQICHLELPTNRRPRVPIPYLGWALTRRGYPVPGLLISAAVKRVAAKHERVVASARDEDGSLDRLMMHSRRHLKSPVLRAVRHAVNSSGDDFSNRFADIVTVLLRVGEGSFARFGDEQERAAFNRIQKVPDLESTFRKFADVFWKYSPRLIAERITPDQFAILFPALDEMEGLLTKTIATWIGIPDVDIGLSSLDPETEIGFVLALIPIIPLILEAANVQSSPAP